MKQGNPIRNFFSWLLSFRETNLFRVFRGIFFIMTKIPFLLVLIGIGYFAFAINDQGQDLMYAFGEKPVDKSYFAGFLFLLFVWAGIIWYVARVTLTSANLGRIVKERAGLMDSLEEPLPDKEPRLKPGHAVVTIDTKYEHVIRILSKIVPRVLAAFPYIIFVAGYIIAYKGEDKWSKAPLWPVIILGILHVTYLCFRTDIIDAINKLIFGKSKNPAKKPEPINAGNPDARFKLEEVKDPRRVLEIQRLKKTTIFVGLALLVSFFYAWFTARSVPSLDGKPGLIILSGLIFYSVIGLIFIYISNLFKFPVFSFLLILILFVALPRNNNHAIDSIKDKTLYGEINQRLQDKVYFENWLNYKLNNKLLFEKDSIIPIFIISAEGGGIRASYWTAQILKNLHIQHPELYNNTFAVTGASGGTVGLSFFYNYLFEKIKGNSSRLSDPAFYGPLDTIASSDYLSGVTYGFLFPDLAQRMIPWPISSFDRAKFLSNAFSKSFSHHTGPDDSSLLDQSMLTPWLERVRPYNQPVVLFNSLYVEEGQKAVFSPYKLSAQYYEDAIDVLDSTQVLVPMKEAMLSSARFPLITPPGLMKDSAGKKFGHLVDGGYFENTAVQTAQQTVMMIKSVLKQMGLKGKKIVPVIITTEYGGDVHRRNDPLGSAYETAPLQGAINTLFRWIDGAKAINVKLDPDLQTINFRLAKFKGERIPLGWYLSRPARKLVENYAHLDNFTVRKPYAQLKRYLK